MSSEQPRGKVHRREKETSGNETTTGQGARSYKWFGTFFNRLVSWKVRTQTGAVASACWQDWGDIPM